MCTNTKIPNPTFLVIQFLVNWPMRALNKCNMLESNWFSMILFVMNRGSFIWRRRPLFQMLHSILKKCPCVRPVVIAHCIAFRLYSLRCFLSSHCAIVTSCLGKRIQTIQSLKSIRTTPVVWIVHCIPSISYRIWYPLQGRDIQANWYVWLAVLLGRNETKIWCYCCKGITLLFWS